MESVRATRKPQKARETAVIQRTRIGRHEKLPKRRRAKYGGRNRDLLAVLLMGRRLLVERCLLADARPANKVMQSGAESSVAKTPAVMREAGEDWRR